jgi:hypothetical protein
MRVRRRRGALDLDAERNKRFDVFKREVAIDCGFNPKRALPPADRERIEMGATYRMQRQNLKARIIRGEAIDSSELIRLTEAEANILPVKQTTLKVQFVGTIDYCPQCNYERPKRPEAETVKAKKAAD